MGSKLANICPLKLPKRKNLLVNKELFGLLIGLKEQINEILTCWPNGNSQSAMTCFCWCQRYLQLGLLSQKLVFSSAPCFPCGFLFNLFSCSFNTRHVIKRLKKPSNLLMLFCSARIQINSLLSTLQYLPATATWPICQAAREQPAQGLCSIWFVFFLQRKAHFLSREESVRNDLRALESVGLHFRRVGG